MGSLTSTKYGGKADAGEWGRPFKMYLKRHGVTGTDCLTSAECRLGDKRFCCDGACATAAAGAAQSARAPGGCAGG